MSILRAGLFLTIAAATFGLHSAAGTAAPVVVTGGKIQVQARVVPAHKIVLDENGAIRQIFSNTAEPVVVPRVYRLSIEAANEIPLDAAVQTDYLRLVPAGQGRTGTLYDRDSVKSLLRIPSASLFRQERVDLLAVH